jgi:sugar phosphate isomerase/epimerase
MKSIALQLYTLREEAGKDFPGVLKRVADIGYKAVETAGLHGHDSKEIGKIIHDLGMQVCSSHTEMPDSGNIGRLVEEANALGNSCVVSGVGPDALSTLDACKAVADRFSKAAELLKPYGMTFAFHNHYWEFSAIDGRYAYDILLEEAPGVESELDVYWTAYAKADSVQVVSAHKSRLPLLHIKDGTLENATPMTPVGTGVVPIPEIIRATDPDVLKWLIVELDECDCDMFDAVKQSYEYLASLQDS